MRIARSASSRVRMSRVAFCLLVIACAFLPFDYIYALPMSACFVRIGDTEFFENQVDDGQGCSTYPADSYWQAYADDGDVPSLILVHPLPIYGDPVAGDGEFVQVESDISFPGEGTPFEFVRTYRSRVNYIGPMGYSWDHNYNQYLSKPQCDGSLIYYNGHLSAIKFAPTGPVGPAPDFIQHYTTDSQHKLDLSRSQTGYTLTELTTGLVTSFSSNGRLRQITNTAGKSLIFNDEAFSTARENRFRLKSVVDTTGRTIYYNYTPLTNNDLRGGLLQCVSLAPNCGSPLVNFKYGSHSELAEAVKGSDTKGARYLYADPPSTNDRWVATANLDYHCRTLCGIHGIGNPTVPVCVQSSCTNSINNCERIKNQPETNPGYSSCMFQARITFGDTCRAQCDGQNPAQPTCFDACVEAAGACSRTVDESNPLSFSQYMRHCYLVKSCGKKIGDDEAQCELSCADELNTNVSLGNLPDSGMSAYNQCYSDLQTSAPYCLTGGDCFQGCLNSYRDPGRVYRFGNLDDLAFNMFMIIDKDDRIVVINTYGTDLGDLSFDRVIAQTWGHADADPGFVSFEYHDLLSEKQYGSAVGSPNAKLATLDGFVSKNICPGANSQLCTASGCVVASTDPADNRVHQPVRYASIVTDIYGVDHANYFSERWEVLRNVNLNNGETTDNNYSDDSVVVGTMDAAGARTCFNNNEVGLPLSILHIPATLPSSIPTEYREEQYVYDVSDRHTILSYIADTRSSARTDYIGGNIRPLQIKVAVDDQTTETTTYTYGDHFGPDSKTLPDGTVIQYKAYDIRGTGPTVVVEDANGPIDAQRVTQLSYDQTCGQPSTIHRVNGTNDGYTFDNLCRVIARSTLLNPASQEPDTTIYGDFDANDHPRVITGLRRTANELYDTSGHLATRKEFPTQGPSPSPSNSRMTCNDYRPDGRLVETLLPEGNSVIYSYDASEHLVAVQKGNKDWAVSASGDCTGLPAWACPCKQNIKARASGDRGLETVASFDYAPGGILRSVTKEGIQYQVILDGFGRTVEQIDGLGRRERTGYDRLGRATWRARFDSAQTIPAYAKPQGGEPGLVAMTEYTYDNLGRQTSVTSWRFEPDGLGSRIKATTEYHDPQRQVISKVGDRTTTLTYDGLGRLVERVVPDGTKSTTVYTSNGSHSTTSSQTTVGTLVAERDFLGNGALLKETTNNKLMASLGYNKYGELTTQYKYIEGSKFFGYDAFGRQVSSSLSIGGVLQSTTLSYDDDDRLKEITDANGHITKNIFDGLSRVVEHQYGNISTEYQYDLGSRRVVQSQASDGSGIKVRSFTYDQAGRLRAEETIHQTAAGNQLLATKSFDYNAFGQMATAVIDEGTRSNTTTLKYDSQGHLSDDINSLHPFGMHAQYEPYGRWKDTTLQAQSISRYYDLLGRTASIAVFGTATVAQFDYGSGGVGGAKAIDFPMNGNHEARVFDDQGFQIGTQLSTAGTVWGTLSEVRGTDGVIRARQRQINGSALQTDLFQVDEIGRVAAENLNVPGVPGLSQGIDNTSIASYMRNGTNWRAYTLDGVGNWKSRIDGSGQNLGFIQDEVNRNAQVTVSGGTANNSIQNPGYDNDGNETTPPAALGGSRNFTFDAFGHVVSATDGNGHTVEYQYDALGRRVVETHDGIEEHILWEGNQIIAHGTVDPATGADQHGLTLELYGDGLDSHLASIPDLGRSGSSSLFYHRSSDGSTFAVSRHNEILEAYSYSAYGEVKFVDPTGTPTPQTQSTVGTKFLYQGHQLDPVTQTYAMRAREYDPAGGRFLSADPSGLLGGINLYAFVDDRPLSFSDPTGLNPARFDSAAIMQMAMLEEELASNLSLNFLPRVAGLPLQRQSIQFDYKMARELYTPDIYVHPFEYALEAAHNKALMSSILMRNPTDAFVNPFDVARYYCVLTGCTPGQTQSLTVLEWGVTYGPAFIDPAALELGIAELGGAELVTARSIVEAVDATESAATVAEPLIYRGVHAEHPALGAALEGRVVPGDVAGTVSAEAHNLGGVSAESPFTSWTHDYNVALNRAMSNGEGGVILGVPPGAPPPGATWSWEWSPDLYHESEVLMRGTRDGVRVIKP